jgi:hypothetical protein
LYTRTGSSPESPKKKASRASPIFALPSTASDGQRRSAPDMEDKKHNYL